MQARLDRVCVICTNMHLKTVFLLLAMAGSVGLNAAAVSASSSELVAQGDRLWAQGKLADARVAFEQAARSATDPVPALMKLGGLMLSSQDFAVAIATYKRVIGQDRNNARAWMGLGMAYLHTQQKDLSRAAFGEAVRIEPVRQQQLSDLIEAPAK